MRITDSAANAILNVMKSKGLNPKNTLLEIGVFEGNLGLGFTRSPIGNIIQNGDLSIVISSKIDTQGIVIDFGEINGKKGLVFLGDENVDNSN